MDAVFADKQDDELTFKDLSRLGYLKMVINETQRLWPTATGYFLRPKANTLFDGKYEVTPDDVFFVGIPGLHRDPDVWGDSANKFVPEHFTPENIKSRPKHCLKPFGNRHAGVYWTPFCRDRSCGDTGAFC